MALLGIGYLAQGNQPASALAVDSDWGGDPLTVAVGVEGAPLQYTVDDEAAGLLPDLFAQAPLGDRQWTVLAVSEADAVAAVSAGAADLALLPSLAGQPAQGLSLSEPLLSHKASLFAAGPLLGTDALDGKAVAWSGPEGLVPTLMRLGAEPVSTVSVDDCLTRVLTGSVQACATDEIVGAVHVTQLGLQERLLVAGDPIGTVDYVLAWRPSDTVAPQVVADWAASVTDSGLLGSLVRQWLGVRVQSSADGGWSARSIVLEAMAVLVVGGAFFAVGRNRSLKRHAAARARLLDGSAPRYAAAFEDSSAAIFLLEPRESVIVEANPRAHEMAGYDPGALLGVQFTQLVPARQRRLLRRSFLEDSEALTLPGIPLVHRDGTVATVTLRSRVLQTGNGAERLCIVEDTTERNHVSHELSRLAQLTQRLMDSVPCGLLVLDPAGYITAANAGLTAELGLGEPPLGQPVQEVLSSESTPIGPLVEAALSGDEAGPMHAAISGPGGKELPYSVRAVPVSDGDGAWGAVLVLNSGRDGQTSGSDAQRMDMLRGLGQISGELAHDIRSRISTASLGIQMLDEDLPPEHPDHQSVKVIREEIDFTVRVVDDILTLLRPGKTQHGPCNLQEIIELVVGAYSHFCRERGVEVSATLPTHLPTVSGDRIQIERALGNLVKNAVEASEKGSSVKVELSLVDPPVARSSGPELRVRVIDHGSGIPPHVRSRLFEPYASEKRDGTGLGLSLVKKMTDDHGGRIEVDSRPNQGTTFTIYLPTGTERG